MDSNQILSHPGKVGCWHGNASRNTDRTYGGLERVMRGYGEWARGEVCVRKGCSKQANTDNEEGI